MSPTEEELLLETRKIKQLFLCKLSLENKQMKMNELFIGVH